MCTPYLFPNLPLYIDFALLISEIRNINLGKWGEKVILRFGYAYYLRIYRAVSSFFLHVSVSITVYYMLLYVIIVYYVSFCTFIALIIEENDNLLIAIIDQKCLGCQYSFPYIVPDLAVYLSCRVVFIKFGHPVQTVNRLLFLKKKICFWMMILLFC